MEKTTHINDFISTLPRIEAKKIWKVSDKNGTVVQYVSASDNRKSTAQMYINQKYIGQTLTLEFSHSKGFITIP
jgi:hypothetical protein